MGKNDERRAFNRAQATRARRFAAYVLETHPDIARGLESIARDFENRAVEAGEDGETGAEPEKDST